MSEDEYGSFDDEEVDEAITLAAVTPARLRLQQKTLFGGLAQVLTSPGAASYSATRNRQRNRQEPPTHHVLDPQAIKTWVYPTNYPQRDYQFNMIRKALFTNVLVALPTGLGKTFIAAVVMYNWYRWAPNSKIIFLAPAKPLVTQQIEACYHVCGIPAGLTAELTGGINKARRTAAYAERRVFFLTPQTFQNDLRNGLIKAKDISCLVVDEAHHATGNYAYVNVVRQMRTETDSFRVLALTATPGKTVETVQEVIDGLHISQIEIRNETSIDIRSYTHTKEVETIVLDLSPEMISVQTKYASLLKPMMQKLAAWGVGMTGDPTKVSAFAIREAVSKLQRESRGQNRSNANAAFAVGGILASLAYNMELLNTHGIRPFYDAMVDLKSSVKTSENKKRVIANPNFSAMMREMEELMLDPVYTGHPKLDHLSGLVLNHFQKAEEEGDSQTRVMIFSSLRVSAEAIVAVLKQNSPLVKPTPFFGQQAGKSGSGMSQKEQQETISKFKKGIYNVIVATSVGEEGLDIGEIDMIVCYDSSSSPARMLQRMGRTGRKRDGQVFVLCVRGKEEMAFLKAKDSHRVMQKKIEKGIDIKLAEDVYRIIPWNINPECEKRLLEVPKGDKIGDRELVTLARRKKAAAKVFNMPDGVAKGFVSAGALAGDGGGGGGRGTKRKRAASPVFRLDDELWHFEVDERAGLLGPREELELERRFRKIDEDHEGCLCFKRQEEGRFLSRDEIRSPSRSVLVPHGQSVRTIGDLLHRRFTPAALARQSQAFTRLADAGLALQESDQEHEEEYPSEHESIVQVVQETDDEIELDEDDDDDQDDSENAVEGIDDEDDASYGALGSFVNDEEAVDGSIDRVRDDDDDDDDDGTGVTGHRVDRVSSPPRLRSLLSHSKRRCDRPQQDRDVSKLATAGIFSDSDSDPDIMGIRGAGSDEEAPMMPTKRIRLSQLARESDEEELPDTRNAIESAILQSTHAPAPAPARRNVLGRERVLDRDERHDPSAIAATTAPRKTSRGQARSRIRIIQDEDEDE